MASEASEDYKIGMTIIVAIWSAIIAALTTTCIIIVMSTTKEAELLQQGHHPLHVRCALYGEDKYCARLDP